MLGGVTSLSNLIVGGPHGNEISIRFQCKSWRGTTGRNVLAAVRYYEIWKQPGYGSGNSGGIEWTLAPDSNGQPQGPVAKALWSLPQDTDNEEGGFPLVGFEPYSLVVGNWYHLLAENTDLQSDRNWRSIDVLMAPPVVPPQCPDMQLLSASASAGSFSTPDGGALLPSPINLFYADGTVQGYPYYQLDGSGTPLPGKSYGFLPATT